MFKKEGAVGKRKGGRAEKGGEGGGKDIDDRQSVAGQFARFQFRLGPLGDGKGNGWLGSWAPAVWLG